MADVTRTQAQLIATFPDNSAGLISAQAGRNVITSCFPYESTSDPTHDWDNVNNAGVVGATGFDTGNTVLNTVSGVWWFCQSGLPHAAVWIQVTGLPVKLLGRITAGPIYNPNLTLVAVTGNTSAGSDQITGVPVAAFDNIERFMQVNSPSFSLGTTVTDFDPAGQTVNVSENATTTGAILFDLVPLSYEWFETLPGTTTSASHKKPGGIVGTLAANPAKNVLGPGATPLVGADVEIWFRNVANGINVYEFELIGITDPRGGLLLGGPLTTPTVTTPPATPPSSPAPGTFYVDLSGNLVYVNLDLSLTIVAGPGRGALSQWIAAQIDFTQPIITFPMAAGTFDVLNLLKPGPLPSTPIDPIGGYAIMRAMFQTTQDWASSPGPQDLQALDNTVGHPQGVMSFGTNMSFSNGHWNGPDAATTYSFQQFATQFPQYRIYAMLGTHPTGYSWTQGHTNVLIEVLKIN